MNTYKGGKYFKIVFQPSPSADTFIASVFKGSNGFDYFNIFDYFMNERITTVTFQNSKEAISPAGSQIF